MLPRPIRSRPAAVPREARDGDCAGRGGSERARIGCRLADRFILHYDGQEKKRTTAVESPARPTAKKRATFDPPPPAGYAAPAGLTSSKRNPEPAQVPGACVAVKPRNSFSCTGKIGGDILRRPNAKRVWGNEGPLTGWPPTLGPPAFPGHEGGSPPRNLKYMRAVRRLLFPDEVLVQEGACTNSTWWYPATSPSSTKVARPKLTPRSGVHPSDHRTRMVRARPFLVLQNRGQRRTFVRGKGRSRNFAATLPAPQFRPWPTTC